MRLGVRTAMMVIGFGPIVVGSGSQIISGAGRAFIMVVGFQFRIVGFGFQTPVGHHHG